MLFSQLISVHSLEKHGGDRSPQPISLCVDQILVYDFHCPVPDVVHPLYPKHLIMGFALRLDVPQVPLSPKGRIFFSLCFIVLSQKRNLALPAAIRGERVLRSAGRTI